MRSGRCRRFVALGLALFAFGGLAGCSSSGVDEQEPWSLGPYDTYIDGYIAKARDGGASQDQIDALVAAKAAGRVDIEVVREAFSANAECLEAAGFTVTVSDDIKASGYVVPQWSAVLPADLSEDQANAIDLACEREHSLWISQAYQMQPEARDLLGAYVNSREPQLRECLEQHGYATDAEATGWELAMQALQVDREMPGFDNDIDCLIAAGIDGL